MQVRKEIRVSGIVQGVGFRPYVYRLATDRKLGGNISNTPAGVTIEIQGPPDLVEDFVSSLPADSCRWRPTEKYDLPDAAEPRIPEPAHRRPRKPREFRFFSDAVAYLSKILEIEPEVIA